jgi:hypothetical protein
VPREARAPIFDEALPLIRRLWTEDHVDHDGEHFHYRDLTVRPKPRQQPPDVWLGGRAKSELRRCGRLGDGWLASFCTPSDCESGRAVIDEAALAAGRSIDAEHFGAMVVYTHDAIPPAMAERLAAVRPELDAGDLVPVGLPALRDRLGTLPAILTPNLDEAAELTAMDVHDVPSMERAGMALCRRGARAAVIKGGHLQGRPIDGVCTAEGCVHVPRERVDAVCGGKGCTFAATLASLLAIGLSINEAAERAGERVRAMLCEMQGQTLQRVQSGPFA